MKKVFLAIVAVMSFGGIAHATVPGTVDDSIPPDTTIVDTVPITEVPTTVVTSVAESTTVPVTTVVTDNPARTTIPLEPGYLPRTGVGTGLLTTALVLVVIGVVVLVLRRRRP